MPGTPQIVNPNLHVILIHTPIAMLMIGTAIELFSFLWRRSSFRAAGRWMILIGALATLPALTTGIFAARQAIGVDDMTWTELKKAAPLDQSMWHNLTFHVRCNILGTMIVSLLIVVWLGCSDHSRDKLHLIFMLLLLGAVGLFGYGAWNGGEMVYAHSMGVGKVVGGWDSSSDSESHDSPAASETSEKGKQIFIALNATAVKLKKVDNVLDLHAMLAGWTVAFALVTLGLSFRALSTGPRAPIDDSLARDEDIIQALAPPNFFPAEKRPAEKTLSESTNVLTNEVHVARVPAARFWLLTALLGISTMLGGWMLVGPDSFNGALQVLQNSHRDMAHAIAGASIVVLSMILALVTRFAPTNKVLVGCFSLLLVAAIAIQFWLVFLLMFDTSGGPLNHINY